MRHKMSKSSRKELLEALRIDYKKADSKRKVAILDSLVQATGYHRKYAIALLSSGADPVRTNERLTKPRQYDQEVRDALVQMWEASNFLCGKRLIPFIKIALPPMLRAGEISCNISVRKRLLQMSAATADRILREQKKTRGRSIGFTQAGRMMRQHIEVRTFADWNEGQPGFLEIDTVSHDGGNMSGKCAHTLTLTDVFTGWTELVALIDKSEESAVRGVAESRLLFPFPVLGIDCDNGTEFMNYGLQSWCERENVTFTRSRPYKKNDQCFVEEKNGSVVRKLVGHRGFRGLQAFSHLEKLYEVYRLYVNFFMPSMKLVSKTREGSKIQRKYDTPKTPYQRVLASNLPRNVKATLRAEFKKLNPAAMLRKMNSIRVLLFGCDTPVEVLEALPRLQERKQRKGVAAAVAERFRKSAPGEVLGATDMKDLGEYHVVKTAIDRLFKKGIIDRCGRGRYRKRIAISIGDLSLIRGRKTSVSNSQRG